MSEGSPRALVYALAALPVLALALALYASTLLPDVGLWDTAEFQAIGPVLGTAHPTGYPSYTLLAWLASVVLQPFGNEAYRADLLSALLMSGAGALLAIRAVQATRRPSLGLLAGLAFVLTPIAWRWGQRADPHALHVFLAALLLVLLAAWASRVERDEGAGAGWLLAAACVYGLALGNHALTLLLAPGIAAWVLLVSPRILWRAWRLVLACGLVLVFTSAAVYLYLPLRSAMDPPMTYADPHTWEGFWYVVLGQQFQGSFALPPVAEIVSGAWSELLRNLGPLAVVALAGGVLGFVRHPRLAALSWLWFVATWLFAVGYPNAVIERYFLVPLLVSALWLALAADIAVDALASWLRTHDGERLARVVPAALVGLLLLAALVPAPERYTDLDASEETRGRAVLEGAFGALEEDAVVVSWWSFSTPLWYGRWVEGRRGDVAIIDDRDVLDDGYGDVVGAIERHLGERPVYLIRRDDEIEALRTRYRLQPVEGLPFSLYRVLGPATTQTTTEPGEPA